MTNLVFGQDTAVADWLVTISNCRPMLYNMAVGLADEDTGALVGGIMFTGWNGSDVEVHYYGPGKLKRRIVRLIFTLALRHFNVNRVTIRTRKEHMARGVVKLGAVFEGTVKRLYGPTDDPIHTGRQYAFFRETIEKLSGLKGTP
jgi:hypothetical protein